MLSARFFSLQVTRAIQYYTANPPRTESALDYIYQGEIPIAAIRQVIDVSVNTKSP